MKQVTNGNAFEYACVVAIKQVVSEYQEVYIVEDEHFNQCKCDFVNLEESVRNSLSVAATKGIQSLLDYEANLTTSTSEILEVRLNTSRAGQIGDVRDIIIGKKLSNWNIGISAKHNHNAVKHSRLSPSIDFGREWLQIPTPSNYFDTLAVLWNQLRSYKDAGVTWDSINKEEIYHEVLLAFCDALKRMNEQNYVVPMNFMTYLLGRYDYYKIIVMTKERQTILRAFNMNNTLHQKTLHGQQSKYNSRLSMPSNIHKIEFDTKSTVNIYFDKGWQISMRIHNASKIVEPSLKFDVQLVGVPTTLLGVVSNW
jgi:hypothetical protein